MKQIKSILLTVFLTLLVFSAVTYTACNKNKCANTTCLNEGVCDGGGCTCRPGFEGPNCGTFSRDKFLFTFNGGDTCGTSPYNQYPVHLVANLGDTTEMTIMNMLNNPMDSAVCTIQSPDSFTFIGSNNSTTYTGYGMLSFDSLHLYYHVIHDTNAYDCKYVGLKLTR